jgi:hypothetical protein
MSSAGYKSSNFIEKICVRDKGTVNPQSSDGFLPFSCQRWSMLLALGWQQRSPQLCNNFPYPPHPIIRDITQQNCCGGNGALSLKKKQQI